MKFPLKFKAAQMHLALTNQLQFDLVSPSVIVIHLHDSIGGVTKFLQNCLYSSNRSFCRIEMSLVSVVVHSTSFSDYTTFMNYIKLAQAWALGLGA